MTTASTRIDEGLKRRIDEFGIAASEGGREGIVEEGEERRRDRQTERTGTARRRVDDGDPDDVVEPIHPDRESEGR